VLADAFKDYFQSRGRQCARPLSPLCLGPGWKAPNFSITMTHLLHLDHEDDSLALRLQRAGQDYTVPSRAASTALAENYVGLPFSEPGPGALSAAH
jgi:p-hydroxybenzoate 3-monooxygenase